MTPDKVVRFRIACDVPPPLIGHGFRIHNTHEKRLRQAAYLYGSSIRLEPDGCSFGPRRLILQGEYDYEPPQQSWIRHKPAEQGFRLAVELAQWTFKRIYGASALPYQAEEPANCRVEIQVRESAAAEEITL